MTIGQRGGARPCERSGNSSRAHLWASITPERQKAGSPARTVASACPGNDMPKYVPNSRACDDHKPNWKQGSGNRRATEIVPPTGWDPVAQSQQTNEGHAGPAGPAAWELVGEQRAAPGGVSPCEQQGKGGAVLPRTQSSPGCGRLGSQCAPLLTSPRGRLAMSVFMEHGAQTGCSSQKSGCGAG